MAELYDATSFMTLKSLETYGLAPVGEAWKYVIEHGTGLDSPVPVNTHGGFLSEGYIHGMSTITEGVAAAAWDRAQPGCQEPRWRWWARRSAAR